MVSATAAKVEAHAASRGVFPKKKTITNV